MKFVNFLTDFGLVKTTGTFLYEAALVSSPFPLNEKHGTKCATFFPSSRITGVHHGTLLPHSGALCFFVFDCAQHFGSGSHENHRPVCKSCRGQQDAGKNPNLWSRRDNSRSGRRAFQHVHVSSETAQPV